MKAKGIGIRGLFRIGILIVVVIAYLAFTSVSFSNVTDDEQARAEASVRSEVNYLCLQLESLGERANAFGRFAGASGLAPDELESEDPEGYRLLSDPIGDVLKGYTLAETGTVAIIEDGTVVASDDDRVPAGSDARELLGDAVMDAVRESLDGGQMQAVPFKGVFDEPGGEGSFGDGDDSAYLLARQQGVYTVVIIEPESMVFRDRDATMARETTAALVILIVVGFIVDRLLSFLVARRIDKMNEALERITSGDLETRVEGKGTQEFKSLASGINATVEALQGWIAEAESRMDSELAAARAIQEAALPRTFPPYPDIPAFGIFATMNAAREVGGDFYDFFLIGDGCDAQSGKLAFVIADVSGKGVPASLFMMKAVTQLRDYLKAGMELGGAVGNANRQLCEGNDGGMFVTAWAGVLDYGTGRVDFVNAGHNPPLLRRRDGSWTWLTEKSGLPLGLFDGLPYEAHSLDCQAGEMLLLYTDGVTEAMNAAGELYGEKRLEAAANADAGEGPEALVRAVRADVASFAQDAEQSDDITILALEICA